MRYQYNQKMISVIACLDKQNGIGLDGDIPWSLSPDMKHFRKLTSGSVIIMGRRTWESIGSKPLPKRINMVLTSSSTEMPGATKCASLQDAVSEAQIHSVPIFIIGGSNVYRDALQFASRVCEVLQNVSRETGKLTKV